MPDLTVLIDNLETQMAPSCKEAAVVLRSLRDVLPHMREVKRSYQEDRGTSKYDPHAAMDVIYRLLAAVEGQDG